MGLTAELDLSGYTDTEQIENGDRVPVGWYRATCADHYEDHNKEGVFVFIFQITGGLYDGKKLFYRIGDPRLIDDADKLKKARDRIAALAVRFGLIGGGDLGKPAAGVDFDKAVGKEMVVRVVEQKGDTGTFLQIGYLDVYPPDHERIPKDVRLTLALPAAREKKPSVPPVGFHAAPASTGTNANGVAAAVGGGAVDPWAGL